VILQLFNSANALLAGAIFLVSAFAQRSFALVLTLAGGVFAFVGHRVGLPFPDDLYGFKPSHLAGSLGVTVALFAMIVLGSGGGRGRDVPDDDDE
jgi:hypothetical protein